MRHAGGYGNPSDRLPFNFPGVFLMLDTVLTFLSNGVTHASWLAMLVYMLVVTQLTIFTVTLYLHRSQTHRGVDFHPALAHFFRFWGWLTTGMVTKEWVAVHRKHHAKVETEEDPHSPMIYGIKKVFWDGVSLYRDACESKQDMEQYGRGTPDDWVEHKLYGAHPYWGPTLMLLISLALFMTFYVMAPTFDRAWQDGVKPLTENRIGEEEAFGKVADPFREFMLAHVRDKDLQTFEALAAESFRKKFDDKRIDMRVIIPAFMISELRRSFEIGFLIMLPFLVIDMIVATLTMSMGMMMLPPTVISLPFKILFFVLIDGWNLLVGGLIRSFA